MNKNFLDTIYLFACGARGVKPVMNHEPDIQRVHDYAVSQGIWQTTFLALKQLYDEDKDSIAGTFIKRWHNELIFLTVKETRRRLAVNNTLNMLERCGIRCCLLKGEVIAELYHNPICRISSDTDILIDKSMEKKAMKLLKKNGFVVKPRDHIYQHFECQRSDIGIMEVHVQLYGEVSTNLWFDNNGMLMENYRDITTGQGRIVTTLGITDGLIFTTLHLIKHFLSKGVGIRQLMDLLLYMKHYKERIDRDRFNKLMKDLNYTKFINNLIGLGLKYLGFSEEELPLCEYDEEIIDRLIVDIEGGGLFGKNEDGRQNFNNEFNDKKVKAHKKDSDIRFMKKLKRRRLIGSFFPNRYTMLKRYPYLKRSSLLLPVAWVHRYIDIVIRIITRKKTLSSCFGHSPSMYKQVVNKRMELIKDLDML
jgi:hypothetical protein